MDLLSLGWSWAKDPSLLRELVEGHPWLAPVVYIFFQALQVIVAPLPGEVTGFVAGYLFGAWWGTFYSMIGITIGSSGAFFLSRALSPFFRKRFERYAAFKRLQKFIEGRGILAAFVCYLIPGFPKDYLSYFLGLFEIPYPIFLTIMFLGRLPATLALALQGAALYERNWLALSLVTFISVITFGLLYLYRARIFAYLEKRDVSRLS